MFITLYFILYYFYFLNFYLFLERGREREREGEKHQCVVASWPPPTGGLALNPGVCPRLGIELATLWFTGRSSIHWATPARTKKWYFIDHAVKVVPIFPPLPPHTQQPIFPQAIPTALFMSMGHVYKFFGYSISYSLLYIPMAILWLRICTT